MTYYPTIEEDLARAKEVLADGVKKPGGHGQIIHAKDIFTAYVLLESFVEVIESGKIQKLEDAATALGQEWKRVAAERDELRAEIERLTGGRETCVTEIDRLMAEAEQQRDATRDLVARLQTLVDWADEQGLLPEHSFTFPDGDVWRAGEHD